MYRFVLAMALACYVGFSRLYHLRFLEREPMAPIGNPIRAKWRLTTGGGGRRIAGNPLESAGSGLVSMRSPPTCGTATTRPISGGCTGRGSGRRPGAGDFCGWNLARRYGAGWDAKASEMAVRRMEAWGLNTARSQLVPERPKAYAIQLRSPRAEPTYMGMPDVYSEEFARNADAAAAAQLALLKDDAYLLGYFIGNEPAWPGRESELVDMILGARSPGYRAG